MKEVESLLSRLDAALGKKKTANPAGRVDFKELKALKDKSFLKLKEGKNNLVFITPKDAADPFTFWGFHNNLQEVNYYSVPCDHFNKNEECLVCKVVDDLKEKGSELNNSIWYPIRQQIEYYAPVVVVDSEATIAEGVKWVRIAKSVMTQFTEWIRNIEKDELPFYSDDEPQKIIISYTKGVAPADQYKLDKKNYKAFSEEQLTEWRDSLKPLSTFILSKSEKEMNKIIDGYFERVAKDVEDVEEEETSENTTEAPITNKLSSLKKKG